MRLSLLKAARAILLIEPRTGNRAHRILRQPVCDLANSEPAPPVVLSVAHQSCNGQTEARGSLPDRACNHNPRACRGGVPPFFLAAHSANKQWVPHISHVLGARCGKREPLPLAFQSHRRSLKKGKSRAPYPTSCTRIALEHNGRQIRAGGFVVEPDGHQSHGLNDAEPVLETPAKQPAIAGGNKDSRS